MKNLFVAVALGLIAIATPAAAHDDVRVHANISIGSMSEGDVAVLERLTQKVLGPVPDDVLGYTAHITRDGGAPAPDCEAVNEVDGRRGQMIRWRCPPGTIRSLGW